MQRIIASIGGLGFGGHGFLKRLELGRQLSRLAVQVLKQLFTGLGEVEAHAPIIRFAHPAPDKMALFQVSDDF